MKTILLAAVCSAMLLASCGAASLNNADGSQETELVSNPAKPADQTFTREDFEGIGTIELPTGAGWKRDGSSFTNQKLNMEIMIQSQPQGMVGQEKEYLDSYNDVNTSDAPGWKRGAETQGQIQGVKVARAEGSFNNGTAMVTRDYLFFDDQATAILQTRASEKNKALLAQITDYIAGSYRRQ